MQMNYFSDESFTKNNFLEIVKADYEQCDFVGCDFSDFNFSGFKFSQCRFVDCNLSLAKLGDTALREVEFQNCKMLGLRFEDCNQFGFSIDVKMSLLTHASFYQMDLRKCRFEETDFEGVDFTEANLVKLKFNDCNFKAAIFLNSNLESVDFREAFNFVINPEENNVKKAKFSRENVLGLLQHLDIVIK